MTRLSSLIWRKKGDFHLDQDSIASLVRSVEYTRIKAENPIQKLELLAYRTGHFMVRITGNTKTLQAIERILSIHSVPHEYFKNDTLISCYSENINDLKAFINTLTPHYAELEEIKPEIFYYLETTSVPTSNSVAVTENSSPATSSSSLSHTLNALPPNADLTTINVLARAAQASLIVQTISVVMSSLLQLVSPILHFSTAAQIMRANLAQIRSRLYRYQCNRTLAQNTENYLTTTPSPSLSYLHGLLAHRDRQPRTGLEMAIEENDSIQSHLYQRFQQAQRAQENQHAQENQDVQEDQRISTFAAQNSENIQDDIDQRSEEENSSPRTSALSFPHEEKMRTREEKAKEKQEKHKFFP